MLMTFLLILAAIIPPILVMLFVYYQDKHEREEMHHLALAVFLGGLSIFPALYLEQTISENFEIDLLNHLHTFLYSFFGIALVEELMKAIFFLNFIYNRNFFNEPYDGIVYSLFLSMGFALFENCSYVFDFGFTTALVRAFTAVPAHAVFAIILGYYLGRSKFEKENRYKLIAIGTLLAVIAHGIYDLLILQTFSEPLMALSAVFIYGLAYVCWKYMKRLLEVSPFAEKL